MNTKDTLLAAGDNPFKGLRPSFGPFDSLLSDKIGIFLSLAWAIAFVFAAYHLLESAARIARARQAGMGADLSDTKRDLGLAAASVVLLGALPVVYGILAA